MARQTESDYIDALKALKLEATEKRAQAEKKYDIEMARVGSKLNPNFLTRIIDKQRVKLARKNSYKANAKENELYWIRDVHKADGGEPVFESDSGLIQDHLLFGVLLVSDPSRNIGEHNRINEMYKGSIHLIENRAAVISRERTKALAKPTA